MLDLELSAGHVFSLSIHRTRCVLKNWKLTGHVRKGKQNEIERNYSKRMQLTISNI